ncbi:F-box/FBD/LRR-repeat protein At5g53840-like [Trifolium pratense]|uniref:F-box/FBD/LRR-repeat protein At5g53840-like n=1 Tax=Trifolium pratense TaxID=57577 RepID=UPI001E691751|nr:F-box/FBD/LRR-repeat protein At5g53840-like [Trifolium pratense]
MSISASEMILPATKKNVKLSVSENQDRLSDLPDCVILHILSFLNAKQAVQTCVLSIRYENLWKRIPVLILDSSESNFRTLKIFTEFVSNVLSHRDSSISLQTLNFKRKHGRLEPQIIRNIVDYALSHNVQQLGLCFNGNTVQTLPSMFSSQSLTHLNLSIYPSGGYHAWFPKSFNLPALTNLRLENFIFYIGDDDRAEPFSIFNRLNNLCICNCAMLHGKILCISSVTLVNLTIHSLYLNYYKIDLCTPSLCTLVFTGTPFQKLYGSNVSSLKHVDIHAEVKQYHEKSPLLLSRWLREFANIKSLTVSATTLQVLSLIPNLSQISPPSLGNLKSLKVKMEELTPGFRMTLLDAKLYNAESKNERKRLRKKFKEEGSGSLIPDGIVNFLLQNSPSAEVEFIDCTNQPPRAIDL